MVLNDARNGAFGQKGDPGKFQQVRPRNEKTTATNELLSTTEHTLIHIHIYSAAKPDGASAALSAVQPVNASVTHSRKYSFHFVLITLLPNHMLHEITS